MCTYICTSLNYFRQFMWSKNRRPKNQTYWYEQVLADQSYYWSPQRFKIREKMSLENDKGRYGFELKKYDVVESNTYCW